jgi:transcriptional regulator with XRE-family HTH domain
MDDSNSDYIGNLDKKILEKIRLIRESKKISRQKIAEALGYTPSTYADMETGRTVFPLPRLLAVLKYLQIKHLFEVDEEAQSAFVNQTESQEVMLVENFDAQNLVSKFEEQSREIVEMKALLHQILAKLNEKP